VKKRTHIVNTVEENHVNFCKALSGKTIYSALYGTYSVTLKELKGLRLASSEKSKVISRCNQPRRASKKSAGVSGAAQHR
jgi:hypothetical protein